MTNPQLFVHYKLKSTFFFISCILLSTTLFAQKDTINNPLSFDSLQLKLIKINHTDSLRKYENQVYTSFLGTVMIEHEGIQMTCDSAHLYLENNFVEAFNNVHITKANGTTAEAQYVKYTGNNYTAYMKDGVSIIDGNNTLHTEELTYNIKTKIGKYFQGGTLQNEETTISSDLGTYNGYNKQAYFRKNVIVSHPKYNIETEELTYNTNTKVVKFIAPATIINEENYIETKGGTYNTETGNATFTERTHIENQEQIIEANNIKYNDKIGKAFAKGNVIVVDQKNESTLYANQANYNKQTGFGDAEGDVLIIQSNGKTTIRADKTIFNKKTAYSQLNGHVIIIDTSEKSKLLAGQVQYNNHTKFMLATQHPVLISKQDEDSLYLRADTMINIIHQDISTLSYIPQKDGKKTIYVYNLLYTDSNFIERSDEDNETQRVIIANHHVKLYSDSLQAVCDSLSYSQVDSAFRLFKKPILWNQKQQASGDTIYIFTTANNKIKKIELKQNALLISQSIYEAFYDQISGGYIDAFFENNKIHKAFVNQNAQSLYFAKDDDERYSGVNISESSSIKILFEDEKIDKIVLYEKPSGVFHPIDKITDAEKKLNTFVLYTEQRPKNKQEILK
ncbi:MAG: OstA-like protein [Chitinophagaceae bacterium]